MGGQQRVAMVPLADMINHGGGRAVNVNWDYDDSISSFVFRARRGIKQVPPPTRHRRQLIYSSTHPATRDLASLDPATLRVQRCARVVRAIIVSDRTSPLLAGCGGLLLLRRQDQLRVAAAVRFRSAAR